MAAVHAGLMWSGDAQRDGTRGDPDMGNASKGKKVNLGKVNIDLREGKAGRKFESGLPGPGAPGRGASLQGKLQSAKGGPTGANQGGASRGSSRLEPSHVREAMKKDRGRGRTDR